MKYRFENFGGIISSEDPPFLAYVDREMMRDIGTEESELWKGSAEIGLLSGPTEVHLSVTNRCPVGCGHCYMGSGEPDPGELDTENFKRALDKLAEMGVFHIAMGGGEALARDDFFELAEYAREIGLVPNLTMSGVLLTPEIVPKLKTLGQVNISMDGIGERYALYRKVDHFAEADRAVDMLIEAGVPTGFNSVLGRGSFDFVEELVQYAANKGVNEIEFLRFKPSGRGGPFAREERMTHDQNIRLWPTLSDLSQKYSMTLKIDCSFVPMLCYHKPDLDVLSAMGTYGCEAGNILLGARSNGMVSGCSFLESAPFDQDNFEKGLNVFNLQEKWQDNEYLNQLRSFKDHMIEPCRSCEYLQVCKGGCHAVAKFVDGDISAPDPDCPTVVEFRRRNKNNQPEKL